MRPYYDEDGVTLYHGDNREVMSALGLRHEDVALLWGDPPYGIDISCTHSGVRRGVAGRVWQKVAGDDSPFQPGEWLRYPRVVLWGANHYASRLPDSAAWWVWDKRVGVVPERMQACCEMAWTNLPGPARVFRHLWDGFARASERVERHLHPTQKPIALAAWGFRQAGLKRGDLVLSPWLGSGGEAVAARDMGLRFVGVELVEEYLDACVARLRQRPLLVVESQPEPTQGDLL